MISSVKIILWSLFCFTLSSSVTIADHKTQSLSVSPVDEIEIILPKIDPEGKPTLAINNTASGDRSLETPPTVLFHRYYYTGDRNFQGPMIPGGATLVVAKHPKTGQQVSVEAQLLPGAPRVFYSSKGIKYVYPTKTIEVVFDGCLRPNTKISFKKSSNRNLWKRPNERTEGGLGDFISRTGVPDAADCVENKTKSAVLGLADRFRQVGTVATKPVIILWESTPLEGFFSASSPPDGGGIVNEFDETVPTLR